MSVQSSVLNLNSSATGTKIGRNRMVAVVLMVAIASVFWVASRYPAPLKRYHAGTQVKAAGTLTFGAVFRLITTCRSTPRVRAPPSTGWMLTVSA